MTRPIVVMGVSGAGKSTVGAALAVRLGAEFIDADSLHPPGNVQKMASGTPLTDEDRWPWLQLVGAALSAEQWSGTPLADVPPSTFGNPVPQPRQVFAIGLNYAAHAAEASLAVPDDLTVFTKFVTSLTRPHGTIVLPPGTVDWEAELVVVIGRGGTRIPVEEAWKHVAGLSVGQDLAERALQSSGPAPQYSLAKSFPGFGPIKPLLVTPDEFDDPDRIELGCSINGEEVQKGNTADMVFPGAGDHRPALAGDAAAARRRHLYWHASRGGSGPGSAALPEARGRTGHLCSRRRGDAAQNAVAGNHSRRAAGPLGAGGPLLLTTSLKHPKRSFKSGTLPTNSWRGRKSHL